jgi:hypothetical protein
MPTWDDGPGPDYLPTRPGTQVTWTLDHRWPLCWICRALGRWPLWNARDHHMDKRHPEAALIYADGPDGPA